MPRSARVLVAAQIGYFLFAFVWLIIAAVSMQAVEGPGPVVWLYMVWIWAYPVAWLLSLFKTHRVYRAGNPRAAALWNLLPLGWVVPITGSLLYLAIS